MAGNPASSRGSSGTALTTKGDLLTNNPTGTDVRLGIGATANVLGVAAGLPAWAFPPGYEIGYTEFVASVAITAVTEATAQTVVSAGAITFDGTAVWIEFWAPAWDNTLGATQTLQLIFADVNAAGSIGIVFQSVAANALFTNGSISAKRRLTPTAAAHTYLVMGFVSSGTANIGAGAGGLGVKMPGFIRITKV